MSTSALAPGCDEGGTPNLGRFIVQCEILSMVIIARGRILGVHNRCLKSI